MHLPSAGELHNSMPARLSLSSRLVIGAFLSLQFSTGGDSCLAISAETKARREGPRLRQVVHRPHAQNQVVVGQGMGRASDHSAGAVGHSSGCQGTVYHGAL